MMNSFIDGPKSHHSSEETLPLYKELAWDFDKDTLILAADNNPIIVTGNDALKIWVYKTLKTERYRYLAYFDDYGITLEKYVGRTVNDEEHGSALFFDIEDTLLVNPYIKEVENIEINNKGKKIVIKLKLRTIYGKSTFGIEV